MNKIIKQYNFRSVFNQHLFVNCDVIMGAFTNSCIIGRSAVTRILRLLHRRRLRRTLRPTKTPENSAICADDGDAACCFWPKSWVFCYIEEGVFSDRPPTSVTPATGANESRQTHSPTFQIFAKHPRVKLKKEQSQSDPSKTRVYFVAPTIAPTYSLSAKRHLQLKSRVTVLWQHKLPRDHII